MKKNSINYYFRIGFILCVILFAIAWITLNPLLIAGSVAGGFACAMMAVLDYNDYDNEI